MRGGKGMHIHVVQQGDSLWKISQAYGVTVDQIVDANKLPNPNQLVIGQALVIPIVGRFYWVKPGDSLWSIAQRFGINYVTLSQINGLDPNQTLWVGLRLYIPSPPKMNAEIMAYIEPRGDTVSDLLLEQAREASPYLTYLALFSYQAKRDGTLTAPPVAGLPEIAKQHGATMSMVITNLEEGAFSGELGRDILQSTAVQDILFDNIVKEARKVGGITDIHFDFEALPGDQRVAYGNFLRRAVQKFHPEGYLVSAALAPKTRADQPGVWFEAHDYRLIGSIVDFVVIMTYEWGYSAGPPLAVSPIGEVEKVLRYALTEIPANKIMMGQNLYGYDWTLPYVPGGPYAKALSPQRALELARRYNVMIQFDPVASAPFFNYVDESGKQHVVWFEDARSIGAKFNLVKRLGLRGVAYWKLGLPFPQNWLLIGSNFNVKKL